jgi:hypothetical protein
VRALSYAILAPNPHNRQPWVVDLATPGEATLYCDLDRRLPHTDPFDRQIVIGLGCFLELLRIAASNDGLIAEITPFPDGQDTQSLDRRAIAHVRFAEGATRDPLFAQVLDRRSNKEPYDTARPVASDDLSAMATTGGGFVNVQWTNDTARVADLRALTWEAHITEVTTPRTMQESIDLMRIGKAEINENPDGIELGGPFLEGLNRLGILTREAMANPESQAFAQGLDIYRPIYGTAMAHIWVVTDGNTRLQQLDAGRAWVRINLEATARGIGLHPLSQALQEFPEMAAHYTRMRDMLGVTGDQTLQMLGRVGYGPAIQATPRWRVETRLTGTA